MKVYHEGLCPRCPSVGREPNPLISNIVIGVDGSKIIVCDDCLDEIHEEDKIYLQNEIAENEEQS